MQTAKEHNLVENNILILSKQTMDLLLAQNNPGDLISLYTFYYYTAKWQRTNQPKASIAYVAKGLHWNKDKVIKVKRQLENLGLIEEVRRVDEKSGKVLGWYIRIVDLWKIAEPHSLNPESGFQNPNAFTAVNKNAFSAFSKENEDKPQKVKNSLQSILDEKRKLLDQTLTRQDKRISSAWQNYAWDTVKILEGAYKKPLPKKFRGRIFDFAQKSSNPYLMPGKTKELIRGEAFSQMNSLDEAVSYLFGAFRRSL